MKRVISFIVIILNVFLLCACGANNDVSFEGVYFDALNYNNINNQFEGIYAKDDVVFFCKFGLLGYQYRVFKDGKRTKIISDSEFEDEFTCSDLLPVGDVAYFSTYNDSTEQDFIYKYDLLSKTYSILFETRDMSYFMPAKNFIVYSKYNEKEYDSSKLDIYNYDLYVYDLQSKTHKVICKDVNEFSIVENKIRYIITDGDDLYRVFEYDFENNKSQKLGEFKYEGNSEYLSYNFTKNNVIISDIEKEESIFVWSADGKTADYTLPLPITQCIAGDKYAYAVCFKDTANTKYNGIYKIDLSTGKYENVYSDNIAEDTEISVYSDDVIYIIKFKTPLIGRHMKIVHKFDVNSKEIEELFRY